MASLEASNTACLRLRGLPFTATQTQLLDWFDGYNVIDALITKADGKPNGQAFVLLSKAEALKAQVELNNKYMGKRFIEVFSSTVADMETARRMCAEQQHKPAGNLSSSQRSKQSASNLHIIRVRGLPFSATPADIKAFLAPIELPDGINSIQMVRHPDLRPTGEAYVHLSTETEVMQALNKHKQMMGKRYIEVFPSCLAELQQSMAPPRHLCYQHQDQGLPQGAGGMGADVLPLLGGQTMPTGSPAAQAAWLQRQQQLLQFQQQMQLQAAAQQKMLATLQQQRQSQAANLRMHAQLQAQAQALPSMLQQMQLNDPSSSVQQPQQPALVTVPGLSALNTPKQQSVLMLNGLGTPSASLPFAAASVHSGSLSVASPAAAGIASSGVGSSLSSNMMSSMSGYNANFGLGTTAGGLASTAAAAATASCSPSPLDVQYVPFFTAPMAAAMLQEMHAMQGLQTSSLQMMSPSCQTRLSGLTSAGSMQQSMMGVDLLSSSANALDSSTLAVGNIGGAAPPLAPTAFCSDPMLQGLTNSSLAGAPLPAMYLRLQGGSNRPDLPGACQEWSA